jgi:putative addiction module component (TIGR02574 family)
MSPHLQKLLDEARKLSPNDRVELAHELFESVDDEELDDDQITPPAEDAEWAAELQRRIAEMESGAVKGIPWEEVRLKLLQQGENADAD